MRKFKDINILGRKVTLFRGIAVNGVEYWRYSIGEFESCLHISKAACLLAARRRVESIQ